MYLDVIAQNAHGSYNRKLAKIAGLQVAVYFAELLNVIIQVIKKGTSEADTGYFTLNRKYIEDMTTLSEEEQLACDVSLNKLEILEENPNDSNILKVYLHKYFNVITTDDEKDVKKYTELAKVKRTDAATIKKIGIRNTMRNCVKENDPELKSLYYQWIDSVYDSGNFLNKNIISMFVDGVNNYTDNHEAKKKILDIAVIKGYKDVNWVINGYERSYGVKDRKYTTNVANAVAADTTF